MLWADEAGWRGGGVEGKYKHVTDSTISSNSMMMIMMTVTMTMMMTIMMMIEGDYKVSF